MFGYPSRPQIYGFIGTESSQRPNAPPSKRGRCQGFVLQMFCSMKMSSELPFDTSVATTPARDVVSLPSASICVQLVEQMLPYYKYIRDQ